jgi:hypothetical protein
MIKFGGGLERSLENYAEDKIQFPMWLLLSYDGSTKP